MKVRGNSVGGNKARPDFNETNPQSASFIKNKPPRIVVGNMKPEGPAIWLNTAPTSEAAVATMMLEDEEEGHSVLATIEDETYGVANAAVNGSNPAAQYNFTVL